MAEEIKYRRPDTEGGYIFDKQDIDYYRATQKHDVVDNLLLGDFNMVGSYVVNNNLIKELVKMQKVYQDTFGKAIFCESYKTFDNQSIKFRLNILHNTPRGKVTASLELLEEIERANGYYKNTNSVLIDSQVLSDTKDAEKKIFSLYNLIRKKDDGTVGAKKENEYDFQNIQRRRQMLKQMHNMTLKVDAKLEKELFEKRIKLLKSNPKFATILEEVNRQAFHANGKFLKKDSDLYYRYLNQIIDGAMDMYAYTIQDEIELISAYKNINAQYADKVFNVDSHAQKQVSASMEQKERTDFNKYVAQENKKAEQKASASTNATTSTPKSEKQAEKPKQPKQQSKSKKDQKVKVTSSEDKVEKNDNSTKKLDDVLDEFRDTDEENATESPNKMVEKANQVFEDEATDENAMEAH